MSGISRFRKPIRSLVQVTWLHDVTFECSDWSLAQRTFEKFRDRLMTLLGNCQVSQAPPWVIHCPRILVNQNRTFNVLFLLFYKLFRVDHTQGHCLSKASKIEGHLSTQYSSAHSCPRIIAKLFSEHTRWQLLSSLNWRENGKKSATFFNHEIRFFVSFEN